MYTTQDFALAIDTFPDALMQCLQCSFPSLTSIQVIPMPPEHSHPCSIVQGKGGGIITDIIGSYVGIQNCHIVLRVGSRKCPCASHG